MGARGIIGAGSALAVIVAALVASAAPAAPTPTVDIQVFQFQPGAIEVRAGTAVTWTNRDDIEHTVTSGDPEHRGGRFDLRLPGRGTTTTVTFSEPGVYPYFCDRHPSMRGEIRVNSTNERSER
jgi:plastocyanin